MSAEWLRVILAVIGLVCIGSILVALWPRRASWAVKVWMIVAGSCAIGVSTIGINGFWMVQGYGTGIREPWRSILSLGAFDVGAMIAASYFWPFPWPRRDGHAR